MIAWSQSIFRESCVCLFFLDGDFRETGRTVDFSRPTMPAKCPDPASAGAVVRAPICARDTPTYWRRGLVASLPPVCRGRSVTRTPLGSFPEKDRTVSSSCSFVDRSRWWPSDNRSIARVREPASNLHSTALQPERFVRAEPERRANGREPLPSFANIHWSVYTSRPFPPRWVPCRWSAGQVQSPRGCCSFRIFQTPPE